MLGVSLAMREPAGTTVAYCWKDAGEAEVTRVQGRRMQRQKSDRQTRQGLPRHHPYPFLSNMHTY